MFHEVVDEPAERTPAELHERYTEELAAAIEAVGVEQAATDSGLEASTLRALLGGETPELTLQEASAVLAAAEDAPDAETIATLARDELLMGMTTAVLDVEAVESGLDGRLEAREVQSKVEGRFPMTLEEFGLLYQFIESEK